MHARPLTTDARILEMRKWIASAESRGVARGDMILHLSNRDVSGLKRSSDVGTHEITFADGLMRFLGVEVVAANASESSLGQRPVA